MSHSFLAPSWLSWTFPLAYSEAKLTSTGDEASPSKPTGQMYTYPDLQRGSVDKSLARQGRKQATATKLGIYSTYFTRSSMHFLAHCSNFCKPLKSKFRRLSVQPRLRGSNDLRVARKMANFQLIFSVQGTGGSPTRPGPENRIGDEDTSSPGRPVSSGLQVPGEPGHCARTRHTWWLSRGVFPSECPSIAPA